MRQTGFRPPPLRFLQPFKQEPGATDLCNVGVFLDAQARTYIQHSYEKVDVLEPGQTCRVDRTINCGPEPIMLDVTHMLDVRIGRGHASYNYSYPLLPTSVYIPPLRQK